MSGRNRRHRQQQGRRTNQSNSQYQPQQHNLNNNRSTNQAHHTDTYSTSNYRHPSTTTTITDPSSITSSQTSSASSTSDNCAISICYSYLIAIFSSFLVVLGIYLSLTRFNVRFLYISLLGLSIEAISACIYCVSNIRSSQLARRKQRINSNECILSNGSGNTENNIIINNLDNNNLARQRQQLSTVHILNNRTLNVNDSQEVGNNNQISSTAIITTSTNNNTTTNNDTDNFLDALSANYHLRISEGSEEPTSLVNETNLSIADQGNSGTSHTSSIIVITNHNPPPPPQHQQQQHTQDQVDFVANDDEVAPNALHRRQDQKVRYHQQSPDAASGDFLSSTGLLANQNDNNDSSLNLDQSRIKNPLIQHDVATGNTDAGNPQSQLSINMVSKFDNSPGISININNEDKEERSLAKGLSNTTANNTANELNVVWTNEVGSTEEATASLQDDNDHEPSNLVEASSTQNPTAELSPQVDREQQQQQQERLDLIDLESSPQSTSGGLVVSGSIEPQVVRRKHSGQQQQSTRLSNVRRTLVMGLSGEEELIEIDEDDLDNMSILPPSYESIANNSTATGGNDV